MRCAAVDDVYYCVVDTRGWLRDPAPLFHTNVDGTRNVLEVAKRCRPAKFVFTSSYVTVGRRAATAPPRTTSSSTAG